MISIWLVLIFIFWFLINGIGPKYWIIDWISPTIFYITWLHCRCQYKNYYEWVACLSLYIHITCSSHTISCIVWLSLFIILLGHKNNLGNNTNTEFGRRKQVEKLLPQNHIMHFIVHLLIGNVSFSINCFFIGWIETRQGTNCLLSKESLHICSLLSTAFWYQ